MDLQRETEEVLAQLIRFDTVNPPGNERPLQEWLKAYLEAAGLQCELAGAEPERPNLVARLAGQQPGPVLGYLSHVDTVLAEAASWQRDPWGGELHDGFLWGRGALDMKQQTAAEAVAVAHLARQGWRPPRGELKLFAVVDEEVGGWKGASWLCAERPDLARCDYLLNEGGGAVIPYAGRRLFGVGCAEKGVLRVAVTTRGVAGHASIPALGDNALLKLAPLIERIGEARPPYDVTDEPRALFAALGLDAADPEAAVAALAAAAPRLAVFVEPTLRVTLSPTVVKASEKINVIPARAELQVDCRMPAGMNGEQALARVREVVGDGAELDVTEVTVGNRSPAGGPLYEEIVAWIGEREPAAQVVPVALPAFTDSRAWREAFPACAAYGFYPMRHMNLFEMWSLIHGDDERIDVRDLGFATEFFAQLPARLLR